MERVITMLGYRLSDSGGAITEHGIPIGGAELTERHQELALRFNELAVLKAGRYVEKGNNNDI